MILNLFFCSCLMRISYDTFFVFEGKGYVCLLDLCVSCWNNCISPLPLSYLCFHVHYALLRATALFRSRIHALWKNRSFLFPQLFEFHFKTGGVCVGSVCAAMYVTIRQIDKKSMPPNPVNEGNQTHSKVKASFPQKGMNGFLFLNLPSYPKGKGRRDFALILGPAGFSQEVASRRSAALSYQTPIYYSEPVSAVVYPMFRDTRSRQGNKKYSIK